MNKLILALAIFLVPAVANAQLFRRGSTGHCAPVVHAKVVHADPVIVRQQDTIQNFIFSNVANPVSLDPRGDTLYSVSRALEYNSPNSALYLDNARRALEVSSEFTGAARGIDSEILQAASIDARGRAVEAAFRALKEEPTGIGSRTTRITLKNGLPVFDEEPQPRAALGGISCLKCHGPDGSAAAKFVIDDSFSEAAFSRAKAAIDDGSMPPKQALSEAEKVRELLRLSRLVPVQ